MKKNNIIMNKKFFPALGIVIVSIILLLISEFTEYTFITNYAFLIIIAAMYLGMELEKLNYKSKGENE